MDVLTCCTRGTTTLGEQVTVEGMAYSGTYQVAATTAVVAAVVVVVAAVVEIEVAFAAATQIVSDERDIWDRTIGVGCLSRRSTRGLVGHFAVARLVGGKSSRLQQMRGKSSVTG